MGLLKLKGKPKTESLAERNARYVLEDATRALKYLATNYDARRISGRVFTHGNTRAPLECIPHMNTVMPVLIGNGNNFISLAFSMANTPENLRLWVRRSLTEEGFEVTNIKRRECGCETFDVYQRSKSFITPPIADQLFWNQG